MTAFLNESVRRILKKRKSSHGNAEDGFSTRSKNGSFRRGNGNGVGLYKRPFDPNRPIICMDESPKTADL